MDLNTLGPILTPIVMVGLYLGYNWLRSKFPGLPANPIQNPLAPPVPQTPAFPVLRDMIDAYFKSKKLAPPANLLDLGAAELSNLWTEIDSLLNLKAQTHEAELKELK